MKRVLAILCALVLGGVLLVAVWAKVLHPAAFADQITAEGLGFLLPAMVVAVLALGIETFLGAALASGALHPWILVPTGALVTFFMFLTGRSYWRFLQGIVPEDSSCGCFGYLVERTPSEAFWGDLLLLVVPFLVLLWARRSEPPQEGLPKRRIGASALLAVGVMLLAWKAPELPVDDLATKLRPGVRLDQICVGQAPRICLGELHPGLMEGTHWVILANMGPDLEEHVEALNQWVWSRQQGAAGEAGADLWLLATQGTEEVETFRFGFGPAFELHGEIPKGLVAPLYRTLPRSFMVTDGTVLQTAAGWPPWLRGNPKP